MESARNFKFNRNWAGELHLPSSGHIKANSCFPSVVGTKNLKLRSDFSILYYPLLLIGQLKCQSRRGIHGIYFQNTGSLFRSCLRHSYFRFLSTSLMWPTAISHAQVSCPIVQNRDSIFFLPSKKVPAANFLKWDSKVIPPKSKILPFFFLFKSTSAIWADVQIMPQTPTHSIKRKLH